MSNLRYLATKSPAVLELMRLEAYERRVQIDQRKQKLRYLSLLVLILVVASSAIVVPLLLSGWLRNLLA